jgi:hypothetical protein
MRRASYVSIQYEIKINITTLILYRTVRDCNILIYGKEGQKEGYFIPIHNNNEFLMLLDTLFKARSKVSIEIISNTAYSCQKARRKEANTSL